MQVARLIRAQAANAYPTVSGRCYPAIGASHRMLTMHTYFVFVLASRHHRHITVDVCADLDLGVRAVRERVNRRLGKRRVLQKLVYVERIEGVDEAIARERQIQKMSRPKLNQLVEEMNPGWDRLSLATVDRN